MLILLLFSASVNSILPVLILSLCYDIYSCCPFASLLPKYDGEITLVIIFIADLFFLFRCCCQLSCGSALSPSTCLVSLTFTGKIGMIASGLVHGSLLVCVRTFGGRDIYIDDYSWAPHIIYADHK